MTTTDTLRATLPLRQQSRGLARGGLLPWPVAIWRARRVADLRTGALD